MVNGEGNEQTSTYNENGYSANVMTSVEPCIFVAASNYTTFKARCVYGG